MSGLESLLRLRRWELDEGRRRLAELLRLQEALEGEAAALETEIRLEQQSAAADTALLGPYAAFGAQAIVRRERLRRSLDEVGEAIEQARDEVAGLFRNAKTGELALERERARRRARRERIESNERDEFALRRLRERGASEAA